MPHISLSAFPIPIIFICFILFILWFRVKSNMANGKKSTWDEEFWKKEHDANFARIQNIDDLNYVLVKESDLPYEANQNLEDQDFQKRIRSFANQTMVDLSGFNNTQLKLTYGAGNFQILTIYDHNFILFIRELGLWGSWLYKNKEYARGKKVLEYSISLGSDILDTYITLGNIYRLRNEPSNIQKLIDKASTLDTILKDSIISHLKELLIQE